MTERLATTPFGGGRFSAAIFQAHKQLQEDRDAIKAAENSAAGASNRTLTIDKWELLRALTEAKAAFGLSDRTIVVLEALLTFHPAREVNGTEDIIVFPSNAELGIRARGMSAPTLRRHLSALVKAGLILRRDSANGKRFARRDTSGAIEEAFGFNLAPVVLKADEILVAAEEVRAHARAVRKVRGEITLHLRDISKTIEAAFERFGAEMPKGETAPGANEPADEVFPGDRSSSTVVWGDFWLRLRELSGRVLRHAALTALEARRDALVRLRAEVETAFLAEMDNADLDAEALRGEEQSNPETFSQNRYMSGSARQTEHHIQNSKQDSSFELNIEKTEARETNTSAFNQAHAGMKTGSGSPVAGKDMATPGEGGNREAGTEAKAERISLAELKQACPAFIDYALSGMSDWQDAREAAELARPLLGISKDAWSRAVTAMGPAGAIVTIAYLVERAGDIKSAGGYLRALAEKAEAGKFRLRPMLDSLLNRE